MIITKSNIKTIPPPKIPDTIFYQWYPHHRMSGWIWNEAFIEDRMNDKDKFIEIGDE